MFKIYYKTRKVCSKTRGGLEIELGLHNNYINKIILLRKDYRNYLKLTKPKNNYLHVYAQIYIVVLTEQISGCHLFLLENSKIYGLQVGCRWVTSGTPV